MCASGNLRGLEEEDIWRVALLPRLSVKFFIPPLGRLERPVKKRRNLDWRSGVK